MKNTDKELKISNLFVLFLFDFLRKYSMKSAMHLSFKTHVRHAVLSLLLLLLFLLCFCAGLYESM